MTFPSYFLLFSFSSIVIVSMNILTHPFFSIPHYLHHHSLPCSIIPTSHTYFFHHHSLPCSIIPTLQVISRVELQMFLEFAPAYFEYMAKAFYNNIPTVLCKILGVYTLGFHNKETGKKVHRNFFLSV